MQLLSCEFAGISLFPYLTPTHPQRFNNRDPNLSLLSRDTLQFSSNPRPSPLKNRVIAASDSQLSPHFLTRVQEATEQVYQGFPSSIQAALTKHPCTIRVSANQIEGLNGISTPEELNPGAHTDPLFLNRVKLLQRHRFAFVEGYMRSFAKAQELGVPIDEALFMTFIEQLLSPEINEAQLVASLKKTYLDTLRMSMATTAYRGLTGITGGIFIPEQTQVVSGSDFFTFDNLKCTVRHELGHHIDHLGVFYTPNGQFFSEDPEFKAAVERDQERLKMIYGPSIKIERYWLTGDLEKDTKVLPEVFTEVLASRYGGGAERNSMFSGYHQTTKYIEETILPLLNPPQPKKPRWKFW